MKLDIRAFSVTCGILGAIGLLLATWWVMALDGSSVNPTWLGHLYRGYDLTLRGSLIGAVWAFFDGLIGGALFAWMYDYLQAHVAQQHRMAA